MRYWNISYDRDIAAGWRDVGGSCGSPPTSSTSARHWPEPVMMMAGSWAANLEPAMQVCSPIPGPAGDIVVVYKVDRLTPSPAFCATGRDLRRTGRVLRVGDAAIQYDELEGGPHAQCAAVVVSSSSGRSSASASATNLFARLIPWPRGAIQDVSPYTALLTGGAIVANLFGHMILAEKFQVPQKRLIPVSNRPFGPSTLCAEDRLHCHCPGAKRASCRYVMSSVSTKSRTSRKCRKKSSRL
jgi:hypothetical protein